MHGPFSRRVFLAFDPNLPAYGQLVTADLPAALMTTHGALPLLAFSKVSGKRRALFSAVTLGLSQLAKYSCVYLYPIFLVIAIDVALQTATEAGQSLPRSHSLETGMPRRWFTCHSIFRRSAIVAINLGDSASRRNLNALSRIYLGKIRFSKTPGDADRRQSAASAAGALRPRLDLIKFEERWEQSLGQTFTWQGNVSE